MMDWKAQVALIWVLCLIQFILFGLRIYVHHRHGLGRQNSQLIWSDSVLFLSLLLILAAAISMEIKHALSRADPSISITPSYLAYGPAQNFCYLLALWAAKASFILFYFSMKSYLTPFFRRCLWAACGVLAVTFIANSLSQFLWCRPFSRQLNFDENYCSSILNVYPAVFQFITNVFTDLMIMGLGWLLLRNLQLGERDRYALAFILIIGCVPMIASAMRLQSSLNVMQEKDRLKQRYRLEMVEMWSQVDGYFGFFATCLPSLRAFLRRGGDRGAKKSASRSAGEVSSGSKGMFSIRIGKGTDSEVLTSKIAEDTWPSDTELGNVAGRHSPANLDPYQARTTTFITH